jgi:CO/xanthine dehydrogenase Mo-binding subunit
VTTASTLTHAPRIGESAPRPDAPPKVQGDFAFGNDLWVERMLHGVTLRSPHAHARIVGIDVGPALAISGVAAVLTHDDVPGSKHFGLEHADQPVFARDVVRYVGEPIAAIAADHPDTARRAAAAIIVDYEPLPLLVDAEAALHSEPIHPDGNIVRHLVIRHGDLDAVGDVVVEGEYEVGMQDQAFLGCESGLAIPDDDGAGVELFVSTQFLHVDRDQTAACLGIPPERLRAHVAGVGGAFGGREDLSIQAHVCLLALRTRRPVKMQYRRDESFVGHVHRHPARLRYRHHARRDGTLVKVEARILLDGGAYASTSAAVLANACCFAAGPYVVPNAFVEGFAVRTNNPPCGAMRGFGNVQACFAHEAQMDRLAAVLQIDPVELRLKNALAPGDRIITNQLLTGPTPVERVIRACAETPLPERSHDPMARPGGSGRTAHGEPDRIARGVGFAVSIKNLMFSEGFDDFSTARVVVEHGHVTIHCACAEVGQGFVTIAQQIAREVLHLDDVVVAAADTSVGSAGSTSASRQTMMSGGAVEGACRMVKTQIDADSTAGRSTDRRYEATYEHHHAPTTRLDADGQGDAHAGFAFAAHRAVVDVDLDLGLVKVVEIATAQDVGRVLNPLQVLGQIEGGIAQGVGLAVMEELIVRDGVIVNASFTDYLLPTALDMPVVRVAALIEEPEPNAPFGAKGVGEPPCISSTAAIAAAIRNATGRPIRRIPVRPEDLAL